MSHVVKVEIKVKDLAAFKAAGLSLGMEFLENEKKWRWWGHSVGDYPLPEGFTAQDLKESLHVLRVKDSNTSYDVGVFKSKKHEGYELLWDFYGSYGRELQNKIGPNGQLLRQAYSTQVALKQYKKLGYNTHTTKRADGRVVIEATRTPQRYS